MVASDRLSVTRLRRSLPLPIFVVVLIMLVVLLGLVCLCTTDHPSQAAERAVSVLAHAPAFIVMWASSIPLVAPLLVVTARPAASASSRASPAELQRFRF